MPETKDLILKHPDLSDYRAMYHNVWCHPETARYMFWDVTTSEEEALHRMERTIAFQAGKPLWTVYEKKTMQPIGYAGLEQVSETACQECGIALGPDFVGKGYGKQLLNCLTDYAKQEYHAAEFHACCRRENLPSKGMITGCAFVYSHSEDKVDPRNGKPYILDHYRKVLY